MGDKTIDNSIYYAVSGSEEEHKVPNADVSTVATVLQCLYSRVASSSIFEFRDGRYLVNKADLDPNSAPPRSSVERSDGQIYIVITGPPSPPGRPLGSLSSGIDTELFERYITMADQTNRASGSVIRDLFLEQIDHYFESETRLIVVEGVRRCGKTVFLHQVMDHFQKKEIFLKEQMFYLQISPTAHQLLWEHFWRFLEFLIVNKQFKFLLLDEIQRVPNWGSIIHNVTDAHPDVQLILCGSTNNLARDSYLTGRCFTVKMRPLSFCEFGSFLEGLYLPPSFTVHLYLRWGGFPMVARLLKKFFEAESKDMGAVVSRLDHMRRSVTGYFADLLGSLLNDAADDDMELCCALRKTLNEMYEHKRTTFEAHHIVKLSKVCLIDMIPSYVKGSQYKQFFAPDVGLLNFALAKSYNMAGTTRCICNAILSNLIVTYPSSVVTSFDSNVFCVNSTLLVCVTDRIIRNEEECKWVENDVYKSVCIKLNSLGFRIPAKFVLASMYERNAKVTPLSTILTDPRESIDFLVAQGANNAPGNEILMQLVNLEFVFGPLAVQFDIAAFYINCNMAALAQFTAGGEGIAQTPPQQGVSSQDQERTFTLLTTDGKEKKILVEDLDEGFAGKHLVTKTMTLPAMSTKTLGFVAEAVKGKLVLEQVPRRSIFELFPLLDYVIPNRYLKL